MDARTVTSSDRSAPEVVQSPASATPEEQPLEESRIIIRPGGEVVIENLSERLVEVALELDPESDLTCRLPTAGQSAKTQQAGEG